MSGAISPTYQSFYDLFGLKQELENRSFQQKVPCGPRFSKWAHVFPRTKPEEESSCYS